MITRIQYLEALEIIDKYHLQENNNNKKTSFQDELKIGDSIIFRTQPKSKYLSINKPYLIWSVDANWENTPYASCQIKDDRNMTKYISKNYNAIIEKI